MLIHLTCFNTPSREIPFALALEVAADLHEWAWNCEVSIPAFLRTIFTQPATVDFWISLWGFKWLSNSWVRLFSRHELDLLDILQDMSLHMNPCPEDIHETPDMEELSVFSSSLLTLKNEICIMKKSSPWNAYPNSKSRGTCLQKWEKQAC